jgi:hypothetical protein
MPAIFHANLHNTENQDTGKEAHKVIKASWLKLLHKTETINSSCNFSAASLMSMENGFSQMCVFVARLQKSLNLIVSSQPRNQSFLQDGQLEGNTY